MPNSANPSHKHHYVPEFYLSAFASSNGLFYRYYKALNGKITEKPVSPGATGYIIDANTLRDPAFLKEYEVDHFESQEYKHIDFKASLVFEKLRNQNSNKTDLHDSEILAWAMFVNSLLIRSPRNLSIVKDIVKNTRKELIEAMHDEMVASGDPNAEKFTTNLSAYLTEDRSIDNLNFSLLNMSKDDSRVSKLQNAYWYTDIVNASDLITSDHPVTKLTQSPTNDIFGFLLALSPKVLHTIYFEKESSQSHARLLPELIKNHNIFQISQAPNFVYSANQLTNAGIIDHQMLMEKYLPMLDPRKLG